MLGIDLKEIAQGGTGFAAAEPVGPQRYHGTRHPRPHGIRQALDVVGGCDSNAGSQGQCRCDEGHPGGVRRMEHVLPFDLQGLAPQFIVTGDAVDIGSHAEFLFQQVAG